MRKMWMLLSVCIIMAVASASGGETKSLLVGVPADSGPEKITGANIPVTDRVPVSEGIIAENMDSVSMDTGEMMTDDGMVSGSPVIGGDCNPCGSVCDNFSYVSYAPRHRRHCRRACHYNFCQPAVCCQPACTPACESVCEPTCEPVCEPEYKEITCTVKKPVWREVQKEVSYCVRVPYQETCTRTYTVNVPRWQTCEEEVAYQVCVPIQEQIMRTVCKPCWRTVCCVDPCNPCACPRVKRVCEMVPTQVCCTVTKMVPETRTRTITKRFCVMEQQERTQEYTVCKWRTEQRTKMVCERVCDWVEETIVKRVACAPVCQPVCVQPCSYTCDPCNYSCGHHRRHGRRAFLRTANYGYGCDGNYGYGYGYSNYGSGSYYSNYGYTGGYSVGGSGCGCR